MQLFLSPACPPLKTGQKKSELTAEKPIETNGVIGTAAPRPVVTTYRSGSEKKETPSIFPVKAEKKEVVQEAKLDDAQETEAVSQLPSSDYTQNQLAEAWQKFAEQKSAGKISDSLKMIFKKPLLKREESVVEIELSTDIERKFLKVEETELVQFLRRELSNPTVTLRISIKEAELKQRLYTDKEKFNYLAEKQPLLLKLKEKLYLDTDF
ncbi:hypothetical protein RT717_21360 [Imperialibacter roseus]|uniref:DNA polymerase-3 subunit gamma/tau n=1 Tax=Imperialibacter roseus TaxID=1324217 RepID=A0ABZ0IKT1_9BACT|nr:hypothetical protein [Imperialibacter roseus]WOK05628.1 hypothetical protein RT717_21360 [Imperialibacter roseus]